MQVINTGETPTQRVSSFRNGLEEVHEFGLKEIQEEERDMPIFFNDEKTTEEIIQRNPTDTNLKCGVIGIGNGGTSVARKIQELGLPALYLNTSLKDLGILKDNEPVFLVEDSSAKGRGAGRNRSIAKEIWKSWNQDTFFKNEHTKDLMQRNDIIFIAASTAGGTGSGLLPTVAFQLAKMYTDKVIILITVLPSDTESVQCQLNSLECLDEINRINQMYIDGSGDVCFPYMAYDLSKIDATGAAAYEIVAQGAKDAVSVIQGRLCLQTDKDQIDERDMLTLVSTPGLLTVVSGSRLDLNKMEDQGGLQKNILNTLKKGPTCNLQKDGTCQYFGMFLDIQDESRDPVVTKDFTEILKTIGTPQDIFVNYHVNEDPFSSYAFVISGAAYPFDRINRSKMIVSDWEESTKKKSYDTSKEVAKYKGLSNNKQHNKLLGSSVAKATEPPKKEEIPDFLG